MDRVTHVGRLFFAIGLAGFGVIQLVVGEVVAGRAPGWPGGVPGQELWAYATAVLLFVAAAAVATRRAGRVAAIVLGLFLFAWALLRNIPVAAAAPALSGEWTTAGKSLVLFAGSFAIAGSLPEREGQEGALAAVLNTRDAFLHMGRIALALFMVLCGIQHFLYDEFVATLVPGWMPGAYFWTYFAGIALIAGGVGLLVPRTAALAAVLSGLMIFSWVWMVHLPRSLSAAFDSRNEWTSTFEALALSGLAIVLWRTLGRPQPSAPHGKLGEDPQFTPWPPAPEPAHPESAPPRNRGPGPAPAR